MNPADYKHRNRRYDDYEESSGLRLVRKSGIPILYVLGICAIIIGMICLGVITDYWANMTNPRCFLYAQTASLANVYKFGSSLSNCYWITYGAIPSTVTALMCGILYMIGVFGDPEDEKEQRSMIRNTKILVVAMMVASVLLLAVCCTLSEGLRVTCTNMGLNAVNGKADNCMDKLNLRVAQYSFPIQTSTMVQAGMGCMWTGMFCFFFIIVLHFVALCQMAY